MTFEITFDFDIKDWEAFQRLHMSQSKQFRRTKLIMILLPPVLFSTMLLIGYWKSGVVNPVSVFFFAFFAIIWILFYPKRLLSQTIKRARKMLEKHGKMSFMGLHKIRFNEKGVSFTNPESNYSVMWGDLSHVIHTKEHYFLYNSPASAIIIPKKKIKSQLEDFETLVGKKFKSILEKN